VAILSLGLHMVSFLSDFREAMLTKHLAKKESMTSDVGGKLRRMGIAEFIGYRPILRRTGSAYISIARPQIS